MNNCYIIVSDCDGKWISAPNNGGEICGMSETVRELNKLLRERDEAREQRDRLAEALKFYADVSKYPAPFTGGFGDLYFDCGSIASKALKSLEGGES